MHLSFTLFQFWTCLVCSYLPFSLLFFCHLLPSPPCYALPYKPRINVSPPCVFTPVANCSWYSRTVAEHYPVCSREVTLQSWSYFSSISRCDNDSIRVKIPLSENEDSYRSLDLAFAGLNYPWTLIWTRTRPRSKVCSRKYDSTVPE